MNSPQIPGDGQPRQINFDLVAKQFMSGLQRHFDLLAFNLAAQKTIEESAYDERVNATHVMPFVPHHRNFEQLQAYARDLLVRQVLNDSLNLALTAMNNAHLFLALIKATGGNRQAVSPETHKEAQEAQKSFIRARLDEKFNCLEKDYGVMCELEDSITALGFLLQILVKQGGVVKKEQLDEDKKITLELKSVKLQKSGSISSIPPDEFTALTKVYHEDDVVFLKIRNYSGFSLPSLHLPILCSSRSSSTHVLPKRMCRSCNPRG